MTHTDDMFVRSKPLIGADGLKKLQNVSVAVFGLGGVGGHAAEALIRAGVGKLTIVDGDVFSESNLNRQLFALKSTIGKNKALAAKERLIDINPDADITAIPGFFNESNTGLFDFKGYDYILDAIDSVKDKVLLIKTAARYNVSIISSMGAGGKMRADFVIADIYKTAGCPLARVMRRELKKAGIEKLKTVYSPETAAKQESEKEAAEEIQDAKKRPPSSISFVPPVCGLIMAGEIIRDLLGIK